MEAWLTFDKLLELSAVILSTLYVILIAREKRVGWLYGIAASVLSIWVFFRANIRAEAILYFYYVIAGVYGWWVWGKHNANNKEEVEISVWKWNVHITILTGGVVLTYLLGLKMQSWGSAYPFYDSATTIFSFIATWMATRKVLENWIYWIIIDAATVYLYHLRGLDIYALLMVLYVFLAAYGLWVWWKQFRAPLIK